MTSSVVLDAPWIEDRPEGEGMIRVNHYPNGRPITCGMTFHQLETWTGATWTGLARVDCVLVSYRATPRMTWVIAAPNRFPAVPDLWLSARAFGTEGDAIDALWRLHGLFVEGEYPADIADAI